MQTKKLILGMGATGISVADFLLKKNIQFDICDSNPQNREKFAQEYPNSSFFYINSADDFDKSDLDLNRYDEVIASPGVDLNKNPVAIAAKKIHLSIIGDIELFARNTKAPIIAITGSNGKTTVTALVGEIFQQAGIKIGLGGNFGIPALTLLSEENQAYVLELSSFQLDTCNSLVPFISCILNITPDHLDRHLTMENYIFSKQKIYHKCDNIIYFRGDANTYPQDLTGFEKLYSFGFDATDSVRNYGILEEANKVYLAHNNKKILPVENLYLSGKIGVLNSLVALAISDIFGIDRKVSLDVLQNFKGLEHRLKEVAIIKDVTYYNDSKATNVGATLAGVENIASKHKNILLVLGGEGKNQDFSDLLEMRNIKAIALIGKAKIQLQNILSDKFTCYLSDTLADALEQLTNMAQAGDAVLLSPACASLDMYKNYMERGKDFEQWVMQHKTVEK